MALRFCDSFDHCDTSNLYQKYNMVYLGAQIYSTGGRRNSGYLSPSAWVTKTFAPHQTWIIHFALKLIDEYGHTLCILKDGVDNQCDLRVDSSRRLYVTRAGTVLGTSSYSVPVEQWHHVQFKVIISNTAGYYEVRLNNQTIISGSGNTQATTNSSADNVQLSYAYFDDLVIFDGSGTANNDFGGDLKVEAILPSANGSYNGWTPSTGSDRYVTVDDPAPNGDTDYNYSSTAGDKFTCNFNDITLTGSIKGIQVMASARKDDAGSRTARNVLRIGTNLYYGTTQSLIDQYTYMLRDVLETNPATGAAWSPADINAAEFGVELVS